MLKHRTLTLDRLSKFKNRIAERVYGETLPAVLHAFAAPDRVSFEEAMQGDYVAISNGHYFAPDWSTHWVRFEAVIPDTWRGDEVHLLWESGCEACVWRDGEPLQGLTNELRCDYTVTQSASGGEDATFYIEVACNCLFGLRQPDAIPRMGHLRRAELAIFNQSAWDLLWDFATVSEMARELPEDTPRAGQALRVANEMVNICDLSDESTWPRARELATPFLAETNGAGQHNMSAIGHAHIDTAWLWPLAETHRKCVRSFSTALLYMDAYPEYRFACSQAQQWEWMQQMHPALYEKMCAYARDERFIPIGGSWVEPDCNIPSGESLVRQFLYGQRFFERECGARSTIFWNPDVFGYSAQLPQIMRGAGIRYFLTQKLSWNQFNKLSSHTFQWEGIDGSRVLSHFPPVDTYNARATVKELLYNVHNYKDHECSRESYYLFGIGDGGGGPTREMLERLRRSRDLDGLPRTEIRTPQEFFSRLESDATDLQSWVGELYFELHRGTYTTQAHNKRMNRRGEVLLHDIEALSVILTPGDYPRASIDELWKLLLLNQFHDIIPGSSITLVYEDSTRDYARMMDAGQGLLKAPLQTLAGEPGDRVLAVNTVSRRRREVVELPAGAGGTEASADGSPLGVVEVPALGFSVGETQTCDESATITMSGDAIVLENPWLRAVMTQGGRLRSLIHKPSAREALTGSDAANRLILFDDDPLQWEAWDMDVYHLEKFKDVAPAATARIVEDSRLRVVAQFEFAISPTSRMTQTVRLTALGKRLDFLCEVDWHESRQFLKVEFPFNARAMNATYEIQFGHLERPTHVNTSWDMARFEVCGHRWADLGEPDFGVALLNDSKYGYATRGNTMRLSLLRSPKSPDPQADMGHHTFTYAVMPHAGDFRDADVIGEAMALNSPMHLRLTRREPGMTGWFTSDTDALIIDTVKQAEDSDALILRCYEAHGTRGTARIESAIPFTSAMRCNLLEDEEGPMNVTGDGVEVPFTPFQVVTLKLEPSSASCQTKDQNADSKA